MHRTVQITFIFELQRKQNSRHSKKRLSRFFKKRGPSHRLDQNDSNYNSHWQIQYDDQEHYFPGVISFLKDVDSGNFKKS